MRRTVAIALMAVLVLVPLLPAACGTVHVDFHTTIKPSGDLVQEFRLEGTGMMGTLLTDAEITENFEKEGWHVSIERSADSTSLIAAKNFKLGESVLIPSLSADGEEELASEEMQLKDVVFEVRDRVVLREYLFQMTLPGSPASTTATEADEEFAELGESLEEAVKAMFSMSWTLTLPGQIVETNADATEGNSATWYFEIDSLSSDRLMMVRTRHINWPIVGGLIAIVSLAVIGGAAFVLIRRQRATFGAF